ncbi:MAG: adenine-specific DNA-methyltransferase [Pseudomonadota bacterium]|nr:adenine-specific DNA-methyltransferase [Pseudomonadota bacterium]
MAEMLVETPETRFVGLMSELFQLHEAEELDFGIYRIIRRHNQQVRAFLGEVATEQGDLVLRGGELAGILEQAFARIEDAARQEKKLELQHMADELGVSAPTGCRLLARQRAARGGLAPGQNGRTPRRPLLHQRPRLSELPRRSTLHRP